MLTPCVREYPAVSKRLTKHSVPVSRHHSLTKSSSPSDSLPLRPKLQWATAKTAPGNTGLHAAPVREPGNTCRDRRNARPGHPTVTQLPFPSSSPAPGCGIRDTPLGHTAPDAESMNTRVDNLTLSHRQAPAARPLFFHPYPHPHFPEPSPHQPISSPDTASQCQPVPARHKPVGKGVIVVSPLF